MNFRSDNVLGCPPEILAAMTQVNDTPTHPYGHDPFTERLGRVMSEVFEHETYVFPVSTGTAANGLALATLTPPWGAVFCHARAHIVRDEWCGPEFFTGGARLLTCEGPEGKLTPESLAARIADTTHAAKPATVSVTQATEAGTVYRLDELHAIVDVAHRASLRVHMDGARFANALVTLGCTPADLSWRAGVDALSFGATKNGTLNAEAVVVFRRELAEELTHRRKRAGQVASKMRFMSVQLEAYLEDGRWLIHARTANDRARRLADGLTRNGITIVQPVEANIVYARLDRPLRDALRAQGFAFLDSPVSGPDVVRLICGFSTSLAQVDGLVEAVRSLAPNP